MDPTTIGALGFIGLVVMVMSGVHIVFATAITGFLGIVALKGWVVAVNIAGIIPHSAGSNYLFSVLPMFIFIGFLAFHAGMTQQLFDAARKWLGWLPGGLAIATVFATAGFAAVSGASTATAAVFSRVAIPEMLKYGYDRRMAAGVVASAGTLATLIPPSAILVIYAIIVEQSVGKLLLAGFLPGIFSAIVYAGIIVVWAMMKPEAAPSVRGFTWGERMRTLPGISPIVLVVIIIMTSRMISPRREVYSSARGSSSETRY